MSDYLPKEVREGLEQARKAARRKSNRLRLQAGDEVFPVLRAWDDGFALALEDAPKLRGLVDSKLDRLSEAYEGLEAEEDEEEEA